MNLEKEQTILNALVQQNLITHDQATYCWQILQKKSVDLASLLISQGFVTPAKLTPILHHFFPTPVADTGSKSFSMQQTTKTNFRGFSTTVPRTHADFKVSSKIVFGRYQIQKTLGKGGMGIVYQAYDKQLERKMALKVIHSDSQLQTRQKERFMVEARAMAKFNHSHIVRIYDVGSEKDIHYIAMEFIEGKTLGQHARQKPFAIRQTVQIIAQIAHAIHYAHENSVIHRDLKPSNIMLRKNNIPVVMDFGLAKDVQQEDITQSGQILGTPRYMAPEQVQHQLGDISPKTDVYALGIILYELLTGQPAVEGDSVASIWHNILHHEPPPLRQFNSKIAKNLQSICEKAIEKDPSQRFPSAKDLAIDLDRFFNGDITLAHSGKFYRLSRNWRKYKKTALALVIGVLLTILGVFIAEERQKKLLEQQAQKHIKQSQKLLGIYSDYQKAYSAVTEQKKVLSRYIQAIALLQKAWEIAKPSKNIKKRLFQMQKNAGLLAMARQNFLLSHIYFQRCSKLGYKPEAKKLLEDLVQEKEKKRELDLQRLSKIMGKTKAKTSKVLLDSYVFRIVQIPGPHVVKKLLGYIHSDNRQQRFVAIRALAKLGDTKTRQGKKDVVEHLLFHMEKTQETEELEELIWAFGWLKDARADIAVDKKRNKAKENSLLWQRTIIPYFWIPIRKVKPKDIKGLYEYALARTKKRDYQGAIVDFSQVLKLDPKHIGAYLGRGYAYERLKDRKSAMADYSQIISLKPKLAEGYINRGTLFFSQGKLKKSMADLSKAISLKPSVAFIYTNRGNTYMHQGLFKKAALDFTKAIELAPNDPQAYMARGLFFEKIGDFANAIKDYTQVIQLNPKETSAYHNRGKVRQLQNDISGAISDYSKAIYLTPKFAKSYNNRGVCYFTQKDFARAVSDYNKAIELQPKETSNYINRGNAMVQLGNIEKSIGDYSQVLRLDPKNTRAYINRALVYITIKNFPKARNDLSKAISLDSKNYALYQKLAFAYYAMEDLDKAIENYTIAISLNPKDAKSYHYRGLSYAEQKNFAKAFKNLSKAISLDPKSATSYRHRANLYIKKGKWQMAIRDCTKAIALEPDNVEAYNFRSIAYSRLGNTNKAIADAKQVVKINPKYTLSYFNLGLFFYKKRNFKQAVVYWKKYLELDPHSPRAQQVRDILEGK